jgi:mannose-6-phosphate isomerase-like protein (cupin superfamily)
MKHLFCPDAESFDAQALGLEGAEKMTLKLLSEDSVWIGLEPGGHTPDHQHDDKERVFVVSGNGIIKLGDTQKELRANDFIELQPNEQHQLINTSCEPLAILCFRNQP